MAGMSRILVLICLAAILLAPAPAAAWGPLGHRLVARLAESQLTPEARAEALRLLALQQHRTLADVATWADELRERDPDLGRRSSPWHYVNIGEHDCAYEPARDCPGGDCIVEAINAQAAILADRTRDDADRLQALKFVVHFVGDVHQPLHAGFAHDRGGNTFQIQHAGRGTNLHALWDSPVLRSRGVDETVHYWWLRITRPSLPPTPFSAVAPAQWAGESCRIALQPGFYPDSRTVGDDYLRRYLPTAERQVQLGGIRLAELLNAKLARQ
jgi:nuclease S1